MKNKLVKLISSLSVIGTFLALPLVGSMPALSYLGEQADEFKEYEYVAVLTVVIAIQTFFSIWIISVLAK